MPCNTIRTTTINLGKVDAELLDAALHSINIYTYAYREGVLTVEGRSILGDDEIKAIKVAYSQQVLQKALPRFGWKIQKQDARHYLGER